MDGLREYVQLGVHRDSWRGEKSSAIILQTAGDHFYGRQLIRNSRTATALVGFL
jgi:hypothetical protein